MMFRPHPGWMGGWWVVIYVSCSVATPHQYMLFLVPHTHTLWMCKQCAQRTTHRQTLSHNFAYISQIIYCFAPNRIGLCIYRVTRFGFVQAWLVVLGGGDNMLVMMMMWKCVSHLNRHNPTERQENIFRMGERLDSLYMAGDYASNMRTACSAFEHIFRT